MKHMTANFSNLDKFEGMDFRRWQKKMHFFLTRMSVVHLLCTPILDGDDATVEGIKKRIKWVNDDYVCRAKYMAEDASSKKFFVNDPKIFDEAMKSHDLAFYKEAINDERDSIMGNNTWELTHLLRGCKPLVNESSFIYMLMTFSSLELNKFWLTKQNRFRHQGSPCPHGEADVILSMRIKHESNRISIS
ncbi:hypothetical protein Tco_0002332 [Tanacetum coccineum]